jgi:hypothetical protein
MANVSEVEPKSRSVDVEAVREVENYVERVEKQMETKKPASLLKPSSTQTVAPQVQDDTGNLIMQAAQQQAKANIVLPLDEAEVREGLHHKIWDAVRWLSEWCVMMIKKYPGRVFYSDQKSRINNKQ